MSQAKIFYFKWQDEQTKEAKLKWFDRTPFANIPFDHITPDSKANWISLTDKTAGKIILDTETTLEGVPAVAWDYKLGNRSALEWILDQYKEKTPKDPTIAKLFNTYKFADYKEQVIDLLDRVCTVSVRTMEIIQQMPDTVNHQGENP
jgi:predicted helicase